MEMMKVQRIVLNFMKMFRVVSFWRNNTCYGVWDLGFFHGGWWGLWNLGFGFHLRRSSLSILGSFFLGRLFGFWFGWVNPKHNEQWKFWFTSFPYQNSICASEFNLRIFRCKWINTWFFFKLKKSYWIWSSI